MDNKESSSPPQKIKKEKEEIKVGGNFSDFSILDIDIQFPSVSRISTSSHPVNLYYMNFKLKIK